VERRLFVQAACREFQQAEKATNVSSVDLGMANSLIHTRASVGLVDLLGWRINIVSLLQNVHGEGCIAMSGEGTDSGPDRVIGGTSSRLSGLRSIIF
jgi:hypothetical protein